VGLIIEMQAAIPPVFTGPAQLAGLPWSTLPHLRLPDLWIPYTPDLTTPASSTNKQWSGNGCLRHACKRMETTNQVSKTETEQKACSKESEEKSRFWMGTR
jgi:hypothetical protein